MAENDNKSIRLMKSEISALTPLEKEVIGSIVRGNGNLPDKMEGEEYDKLLQEVVDTEVRIMKRQPLSDRQREILLEESKCFDNGIEGLAKEMHVDADFLKASLGEHKYKPYAITVGTDNRPGGVEGEYHLQFKPDVMNVTFGEQEEIAKEFGGTMRVTDGQEWADFYHEADAVKFAEKVIHMNQERETAANKKKEGTKITVKGSHGKVLNLIPSDDPVKNRIVETLKDCLVFHDAKSVDDVLDKTKDSYEMKVWNRLNKDLWEIAYRKNNTDIRLNISSSDDLSKIKVVEHERRYYGQSDIDKSVGDFDLKALDDIELSKVDVSLGEIKSYLDTQMQELADAKAKLIKVLDSSIVDLGDTILIKPTTVKVSGIKTPAKAVFLAPDGKGGGEFRLAGEGYSVLATGKNGHTEFDVSKILDDVSSVNGLMKAVHDVHVAHLEGLAKHAIPDRITNAWQRFFTPDQLKILNRYHQVSASDKPAGEVFKELLQEVSQEPDIARKPEKWITDTAKELNDLAEGITSEQSQGLKQSY